MFAPGVGVTEDAATGSAAGPLGGYLAEHGVVPAGRLTIAQGGSAFSGDDDPELVRAAAPFSLKLIESLLAARRRPG